MKTVGWILLVLSAFMFIGYLGAEASGAAAVFALIITVVLPAAAGLALVTGRVGTTRRIGGNRDELRRQTLEAELLRLAGRHGGRITIVEAVGELAVTPEEAKEALDALSIRGLADFEVTDSGVIVYVFHDLRHIGEKDQSRGLLE
jgi:hypothetical protein